MDTTIKERTIPKSLGILMAIGIVDLLVTAMLHSKGLIVELNPVMKPFIEQSEWLFAFVKALTLIAAYVVMLQYARQNIQFVRNTSRIGILLYSGVWLIWFTAAM